MTQQTPPKSFWARLNSSISFKLVIIGFLILLLLIPAAWIKSLIREREQTRNSVVNEIGTKWGTQQTITGPVFSVPYYTYLKDDDKIVKQIEYAHFLPNTLNINGDLDPEIRYRSIYKVITYNSNLGVDGVFPFPDFSEWNINENDILWKDAFVSIGITDMRGIQKEINVIWNGKEYSANPGIETKDVISSGVSTRIPISLESKTDSFTFSFKLNLNGSEKLYFSPLGKTTKVNIKSDWSTPSFNGAFLPDERTIDENGFTAEWEILHLNRNYPQKWRGKNEIQNNYTSVNPVDESSFGVNLLFSVDNYQKTMRSAKYAIMFITLTFLVFFFIEVTNRKRRVHPIQYLLVGLGLSIFYSLLLSLSEQIPFVWAYIISGGAIIGLITAYSGSIFKSVKTTLVMSVFLTLIYTFLFIVLQQEDYALLLGSIGLFIILAVVMFASRNIDWYKNSLEDPSTISGSEA